MDKNALYKYLIKSGANPSVTSRRAPYFVLMIENDDNESPRASHAQVHEFVTKGTVDGQKRTSIGIRYDDAMDNDVAIWVPKEDLAKLIP